MKLYTHISEPNFNFKIDHSESMVLLGSCFSDEIGKRLIDNKFKVSANPFGNIYNPVSLAKLGKYISGEKKLEIKSVINIQNSFCHLDFPTKYNGNDPDLIVKEINNDLETASEFVKNASCLFLTLGTAIIYKYLKSDSIVANCHKIPTSNFSKTRLSLVEIENSLSELITSLRKLNPALKIIFTLSPVRHTRDGLEENSISKSSLRLAIANVIGLKKEVFYFPSYEMMVDDLRDYRFYKKDLIHPNEIGLDYIFHHFSMAFFSSETQNVINEISSISRDLNHEVRDPNAIKAKQFYESIIGKISRILLKHPNLDFKQELQKLGGK